MTREPELVALRKLAEDLAHRRGERCSTGHLLAALAARPGAAADLLRDRRLDVDVLLRAARVVVDDSNEAVVQALQRAREFASRSPSGEPLATHLLFALCHDRGSAAHRAIEQCGTDVGKLRTAAMQVAMGLCPPRRTGLSNSSNDRNAPPKGARRQGEPFREPNGSARRATSASFATGFRPTAPVEPPGRRAEQPTAPSPPAISPLDGARLGGPSPTPARPGPQAPSHPIHRGASGAHARKRGARPEGDRFALDPKRFPLLTQLGKNLTLAAAKHDLDPVVGREEEIELTLDILAKRRANNPCLVGAAGVGKTSIVRGLASRIAERKDVVSLDDKIVIEIEPGALLAGTGVRGALSERIAELKAELARAKGRVVLFFDEIHALFGPDAGDEAASELKTSLATGELVCIGATTTDEYRRSIDIDPALARRFTPIEVRELEPEEAFMAIEQVAPAFERHHEASFAPEALAAAVRWSVRYMPGRALPDKAVCVLDLAGARARRRGFVSVGPEQVAEVVSEMADVPLERLLESDRERMLRLESILAERIVGHDEALGRIATILRRNAGGFRSRRPIGSFLLLGPTGVGKTETAKAVAECLFHSEDAMTRLDFSEYAEAHAVARLVGAPPGYVGHESGGQLTETVRRRPYQVLLLDEIEKAHRDVLEAFLQVFDDGRLTDGRGKTIDFTNTVIFMTSNLGSDVKVDPGVGIGFGRGRPSARDRAGYVDKVVARARGHLPPELYNRIDEVIVFAPLERKDVAEVARRMLAGLARELASARSVRLEVSDDAIEALLDEGGFDRELGARPMRRAIARLVEAPVAEMILRAQLAPGDIALVDAENGRVYVDAVTPEARVPA